jgi:hypothetical protein
LTSGADAACGVEGGGGGQRIGFRRPEKRANRLTLLVARPGDPRRASGPPPGFARTLRHLVNLELEQALHEVEAEERLDEEGRARKRRHRWRRLELDLDVGDSGRMKRGRDVAPADLNRPPLAFPEIA